MLNQYLLWYEDHRAEIVKFGPESPYKFMLSVIESIKREILKYFPEENNLSQNKLTAKTIDSKTKKTKSFPEFLLHSKKNELAEKLKDEFKNEKGVGILLMIEGLLSYDPQLITIGPNEQTLLYESLITFFGKNIGSRQAIFTNYPYFNENHKSSYEKQLIGVKAKIDLILDTLKDTPQKLA
jgi:hypothetical protein